MILLLALLCQATMATPLYRPSGHTLKDSTYELNAELSLWQSSALYDVDGTETAFEDTESFTKIDTDVSVAYGFNNDFTVFGKLRFRQLTSEYTLGSEDLSVTNSGVESYGFGFLYGFKSSGQLRYNIQGEFSQTAYTNTEYANTSEIPNDEIVLGDSGSSYKLGVNLSYLYSKDHYLNASGFYHQPANDLSAELPWSLDSTWLWDKWSVSLGLEGVLSMGGDEFSDNPAAKVPQGRGATAMFQSINREYIAPKIGAYYSFGNWRVGAQLASVVSGVSTDKGNEVTLSLFRASQGKSVSEIKKKQFKEYRIEATILKVSPRGRYVQIDHGLSQDVEKNMIFDIYKSDYFGGNELVASAVAHEVGIQKSILRIVKVHSKLKVKKGFVARAQ